MDDSLEAPGSITCKTGDPLEEEDEQQSDEEDGGLDWTKLLPPSARPVIPKRGEKEYEPRAAGGTSLQAHILDRSRNAMLETLRTTRSISSKAISYAIWHPDSARTEVTVARGIHFSSMGHSAPRSVVGDDGAFRIHKRLELLPEEAIYLIERSALFCWKEMDSSLGQVPGLDEVYGSPMSVQQAYSEMLGTEDTTLEKYQVFSYLKRLGYVVTRAIPPDSYYPTPPKLTSTATPRLSILERIKTAFFSCITTLSRRVLGGLDWWRPIRISCWLRYDKNYASLFRSLRIIPAGHGVPALEPSKPALRSKSPYHIFYNVYKPSTPFKKSSPPPPDFQLVVVNARTTPLPTLQDLAALFDVLPEMPIPPPRRRNPQTLGGPDSQPVSNTARSTISTPPSPPSFIWRFLQWIFPYKRDDPRSTSKNAIVKPNPFVILKHGKKFAVVAAVDMGNISFFKFGQGDFSEYPIM